MSKGIRAMLMRGGTSKGLYFLKDDLPQDKAARDAILLQVMGSPDQRQIDGVGGGNPLTSKIAIVSKSKRKDADIDYLFLQVFVDQALVSDAQNCGNILAGVAPFAIERGLHNTDRDKTQMRIFMENTGQIAVATVHTPNGTITYQGRTLIDGVPFESAPVDLAFQDSAGSICGRLLPSAKPLDVIDGLEVTLIDNGMPCVILNAKDLGVVGDEPPKTLEADTRLRERVEALRLACGPQMKLGNVAQKSVPKMILVSPPINGGAIHTRSFIPHKCHSTIGVMAAVTVATALYLKGSVAAKVGKIENKTCPRIPVEHPSGATDVFLRREGGEILSSGIVRTARKLMDGTVFPRQNNTHADG